MVSYLQCILYLVSVFGMHTGLVSSFGGCVVQVSYLDTARRPVSFLLKKARFVTTSNALEIVTKRWFKLHLKP